MSTSSWIGLLGGLYSSWSSYKAGKDAKKRSKDQAAAELKTADDNAKISLYDADISEADAAAKEYEAGVKLEIQLNQIDKVIGNMRAGFGKSGVAMSGSALDAVIESARDGAKDAEHIVYEGRTASSRRRDAATRYRMLADAGLRDAAAHASIVEDAGLDEARYLKYQGISTGISTVAQYGESQGWWD